LSDLGYVKFCLDYLEFEMTDTWLYGGIGYVLIINIGDNYFVCGLTAWVMSLRAIHEQQKVTRRQFLWMINA
jgi:hypothetical protein